MKTVNKILGSRTVLLASIFLLGPLAFLSGLGGAENHSPESGPGSADDRILKVGIMPAVDAAPMLHALEAGYFDDEGIEVSLELFTNAQDRQSALQTGAIDGAMSDLVALAVNVAGGFDIRATTLTDGMFPLLARPGALDKGRLKVGLMEVSVSNFLVDAWLAQEYELEKIYINAIPARLEALLSGGLDMGLFPEPVSSVGQLQGLEELIYPVPGGYTPDVLVFTSAARTQKAPALRAFHRAYDRAVADLRGNPELVRAILMGGIPNINPAVRDLINLPDYHPARLPDEDYLTDLVEWTSGVAGRDLSVSPADLVDASFLPGDRAQ